MVDKMVEMPVIIVVSRMVGGPIGFVITWLTSSNVKYSAPATLMPMRNVMTVKKTIRLIRCFLKK